MVNGLLLGLGVFCFLLSGVCFYVSTKPWSEWRRQIFLAVMNGVLGIINFTVAFN